MQYFEDIQVGNVRESVRDYELTAGEIIGFCSKWDPLPFHVDEQAAAETPVGKLFTSAIHTVAIAIRLGHELQTEPVATAIGLGWDEVRFHAPACAGDRLRLRGEIIETRASESRPGLGIIRSRLILTNQRGETVISFKAAALLRRRPRES
ncbi:MAG: MaoC/PaaZ C-terminal domain-containing protein [Myxococcales bacterium]|nr:MaoC/PaaZ C-terminal domain-containing protein [Myxococcales bacterium]